MDTAPPDEAESVHDVAMDDPAQRRVDAAVQTGLGTRSAGVQTGLGTRSAGVQAVPLTASQRTQAGVRRASVGTQTRPAAPAIAPPPLSVMAAPAQRSMAAGLQPQATAAGGGSPTITFPPSPMLPPAASMPQLTLPAPAAASPQYRLAVALPPVGGSAAGALPAPASQQALALALPRQSPPTGAAAPTQALVVREQDLVQTLLALNTVAANQSAVALQGRVFSSDVTERLFREVLAMPEFGSWHRRFASDPNQLRPDDADVRAVRAWITRHYDTLRAAGFARPAGTKRLKSEN